MSNSEGRAQPQSADAAMQAGQAGRAGRGGGATGRWRSWLGRSRGPATPIIRGGPGIEGRSSSEVQAVPRRLLEGVPPTDGVPRRALSIRD